MAIAATLVAAHDLHADELKCEGPFGRDADHNQLVAAFGPANIARETLYEEDTELQASIVFPNDPARRLEVIWRDERGSKRPSIVRTQGIGWFLPGGVGVDTSLTQVEVANGGPFLLYGFSWDYGGTASDWKGGALAKPPGGCNLLIIFSPDETAGEDELLKVAGDSEFGSDAPEMKAVRPKVSTIGFGYPQGSGQ